MDQRSFPFERHIFVCTFGQYCPQIDGNSLLVHKLLKEQIAAAGMKSKVRVNNSGCLDQCGHGPMIVEYPENVWYSHVTPDDVPVIVEQHLKGGVPVERLRYHPPKPRANKLLRDSEKRAGSDSPMGAVLAGKLFRSTIPMAENPTFRGIRSSAN